MNLMDEAAAAQVLRERVSKYRIKADFAREHGISSPMLSDVLAGRRRIPLKLLEPLGLEIVWGYQKVKK